MEAKGRFRDYFNNYISKFTLLGVFLVVNFLIVGVSTPVEAASTGEGIFQQKCASCHTVGGGVKVGPDLKGVNDRREKEWLLSYVREAANVKAKKDPIAVELAKNWKIAMPNTGISKEEATAVITYLENQTGATATPTPTPTPILIEGDAVMGRNLYVGAVTFKNGGGACIACHNASGTGTFGGGILGPDLSNTYSTYGQAGLSGILSTSPLPFPTMKPIYDSQPITPEEAAHLTAYFAANVSQQSPKGGNQFILFGFGGSLVLLALSGVLWRKRLKNVRRTLIEQSYKS